MDFNLYHTKNSLTVLKIKNFLLGAVMLALPNLLFAQAPNISYPATQSFTAGSSIKPITPINIGGDIPKNLYRQVSTIAGNLAGGSTNGQGISASFNGPTGVAIDAAGNIYVADQGNNLIRKISVDGLVTTFAGSGLMGSDDGNGTSASFNAPFGIAIDSQDNIYIADSENNKIRKITPSGQVTTFAGSGKPGNNDGIGTAASFSRPTGLAIDSKGNIFVADFNNCLIRKISPSGVVTTFAGNGTYSSLDGVGRSAGFYYPVGIVLDANGNAYVTDSNNNLIRKITTIGEVTTLAGSIQDGNQYGVGTDARFYKPGGIVIDGVGNIYVADTFNHLIKKIDVNAKVSFFAGGFSWYSDGIGAAAGFQEPEGMSIDKAGNLIIADYRNNLIRKISTTGYASISPALPSGLGFERTTGSISGTPKSARSALTYTVTAYNLAGSSTASFSLEVLPSKPIINSFSPTLAVAESTINILGSGFTGTTAVSFGGVNAKRFIVLSDTLLTAVVGAGNNGNISVSARGFTTNASGFNYIIPPKITYPNSLSYTAGNAISLLSPTNTGGNIPNTTHQLVTNLAGSGLQGSSDGLGNLASFNNPYGIALDKHGNLIVVDSKNYSLRKISKNGQVSTLTENGFQTLTNGNGKAKIFYNPTGVAIDQIGNIFLIDYATIFKIDTLGNITPIAGKGAEWTSDGQANLSSFYEPSGIATDFAGNIYIAEQGANQIQKISPSGVVSIFVDHSQFESNNKTGSNPSSASITGIATDAKGNIYVDDAGNNLLIKVSPTGTITKILGDSLYRSSYFSGPNGMVADADGNVYLASFYNNTLRKIDTTGKVSILNFDWSGVISKGKATPIGFQHPSGITIDDVGNIYLADYDNNLIRKISTKGYSKISPALPSGLQYDATTGIISGTSNHASPTTNYVVAAYNMADSTKTSFNLTVQPGPPQISTFGPTTAGIGTVIAIYGTGFTGTSSVSFGGSTAQSFKVLSDTVITAVVGSGTSGDIAITTRGLSISINGFDYINAPNISFPNLLANQSYIIRNEIAPIISKNNGGAVPALLYGKSSVFASNENQVGFNNPEGVATDLVGNVYVADFSSNLIRKITPTGEETTFAGSGNSGEDNGLAVNASFYYPFGISADPFGNVFVTDYNGLMRKISKDGVVSTFGIFGVNDFAADIAGNFYTCNKFSNYIYKISPSGLWTILAGNGTSGAINGVSTSASFNIPWAVTADLSGNTYVSDYENNLIRKISADGIVTTLAGGAGQGSIDSTGVAASFNGPKGISTDALGNIYVIDGSTNGNSMIRKISPSGKVSTLINNLDYTVQTPEYSATYTPNPTGIATDAFGNVYFADWQNNNIRKINAVGYSISPNLPTGLYLDLNTGTIKGTPSIKSKTTTYTLTAYNLAGSSTATFKLSVFDLPAKNYHLIIRGETCNGTSNGSVAVKVDTSLNYTATLTGNGINNTQKFTDSVKFNNLPAGTYTLTFTIDGQANYSSTYTVTVTQPQPLSVYAAVNNALGTINLALSGGTVYHIQVNNKAYTTTESSFSVPLEPGNNALQVTTDRECQGIFSKLINPSLNITPYPIPFESTLNLNLGSANVEKVSVRIYSTNTGMQVYTADYQNQSGVLQLDLSRLAKGVYSLHLILNNNQQEFKVIK